MWNLALEQFNLYRPRLGPTPRYATQSAQLTEARSEFEWLKRGSHIIQQQALRDLDKAKSNWWAGTHRRPMWRRKNVNEGFRVVGPQAQRLHRINNRWTEILIPKVGWVKFRSSRPVGEFKSYRVTLDPSGRWHIAFAIIPKPLNGPGDGSIVGIDRGVTIALTCSDGSIYQSPRDRNVRNVRRLQRRLAKAKRGSNRRTKLKRRIAKIYARNADARKDFIEKASTEIAQSFDLIRIEDLRIKNMTQSAKGTIDNPGKNVRAKAGLNRVILAQGWGMFADRLEFKAQGRVEKINPAFTSQTCSSCGYVAKESRESQSKFCCVSCKFTINADLNAAINIAAGHAVTARRGLAEVRLPLKREPQLERAGT